MSANVQPARAFVVVGLHTREVVSHELPTYEEGLKFIDTIRFAEGDDFEVIAIE
jgi:hypothetical protein